MQPAMFLMIIITYTSVTWCHAPFIGPLLYTLVAPVRSKCAVLFIRQIGISNDHIQIFAIRHPSQIIPYITKGARPL